ncbi:MAG: DUF2333 family protein [Pseudomonadota bacterium]|nr:DUF2333 family protein [Pseudomonadota bacterium]
MDISRFFALLKEKFILFARFSKQQKERWPAFLRQKAKILQKKLQNFKFKKIISFVKKISKKISDSWKFVLSAVFCFLFVYYILGSLWVEDINVTPAYTLPKEKSDKLEMANTMSFLIDREIDSKMWTPNLPFVFPAYILDNMPNFQIGVISSVRDTTGAIKHFANQTPEQKEHIKQADEFLRYPPNIWLMSRKGAFGLSPSSNAQYRKARRELRKYNKEKYTASAADFTVYLKRLDKSLRRLIQKNDSQIIEHSSQIFDTKADDVFYKTRGYAFGAWQIALSAGSDFKTIIVDNDIYTEWTYLLSSLQKAAEFSPIMVRNAELDSLFGANHLIVQNYYLERALVAVIRIQNKIQEKNAY